MEFLHAIEQRRSVYNIGKNVTIKNDEITKVIEHNLKHTPSAYNSQSQRLMVLFGEKHDQLWDIVMESLRKIVPEDKFDQTETKINGFKAGYGTVLFYDDSKTTNGLVEKFPLYKDNFLLWKEQQNGMLQGNIWSALATLNLGASLQHYSEVIEGEVKKAFDVPKDWELIAQMPFGSIEAAPKEKTFIDLLERMKVLGK